jgi:hypothetical protein
VEEGAYTPDRLDEAVVADHPALDTPGPRTSEPPPDASPSVSSSTAATHDSTSEPAPHDATEAIADASCDGVDVMAAMGLPSTFITTKVTRRRRSKAPDYNDYDDDDDDDDDGPDDDTHSTGHGAVLSPEVLAAMHADADWTEYWAGWQQQIGWEFWNTPPSGGGEQDGSGSRDEAAWLHFYAARYKQYFWGYWGGRPEASVAAVDMPYRHTTHAALRRYFHAWGLAYAAPPTPTPTDPLVTPAAAAGGSSVATGIQIKLYPAGNPHGSHSKVNFGFVVPGADCAAETPTEAAVPSTDGSSALVKDRASSPVIAATADPVSADSDAAVTAPGIVATQASPHAKPHPKYWAQR